MIICFNKKIKFSFEYDKMYFEVLYGKRNYYIDGIVPSLIVFFEGNDGNYLILTYKDSKVLTSEEGIVLWFR
ncbi:MAG: hypothetical protein IKF01_00660 [Bacilli bacterium]|nr:hypothetical protein [Bacilli bacterium]